MSETLDRAAAALSSLPSRALERPELLELVREIAGAHDAKPAQVALAWLISLPRVVVIPGASSVAQLESNAAAAAIAREAGMRPAFETARMYTGDTPAIPVERVFGVTSFELG
jgi:aryl-alcohol dehydrogenase-like predicted oxidoreductase